MTVRVLVVDDQEPFRLAAAAVVAATDGFQLVGSASGGESSIAAVAELHPDLVLMDIHLPGIDGAESTRRIRAQEPGARAVALLLRHLRRRSRVRRARLPLQASSQPIPSARSLV